MGNFEFKSRICTTKEQSERLLKLGLKKETADMCWQETTLNGKVITYPAQDVWHCSTAITNFHIPAWSLHRLVEMINLKIQFRLKEKATVIYNVSHLQPFQSFSGFGIDGKSYYNSIINAIEWLIKEGYFNKDYLEEKQ